MKKILAILLSMVMAGMVFGSCGSEEQTETQAKTADQISSEDDQNKEPTENDYKEQLKAIYDALKDHPFSNGNPAESELQMELGFNDFKEGTTEADIVNTVNGIYDSSKYKRCFVDIMYNTSNNYSIDSITINDHRTEKFHIIKYYPNTDSFSDVILNRIANGISTAAFDVYIDTKADDQESAKIMEVVDFSDSASNSEIGHKIVEKYNSNSNDEFNGRAFVYCEDIFTGVVCTYDDNWSSIEFAPYDFETYFKSDMESKGWLSFDAACEYLSRDDVGVSAYKEYKDNGMKDMFADVFDTTTQTSYQSFDQKYGDLPTWKDVKYDVSSYLNMDFTIMDATCELDDYYNYDYKNTDEKYFCFCAQPAGAKISERWYVYADRTKFNWLFEALKDGKLEGDIVVRADYLKATKNGLVTLVDTE